MSFRQSGTVRLTTTRGFDAWNRLTNIQSVAATGLVSRLRWTYDERGQRVRADWADGSRWVYSYDAYGQLQSGRRYWADGTLVAGQQFEYRHDAIGNRTAGAWGGDERGQSLHWSTNTVNRLNQYTSRTVPPYVAVSGEAATNATVTLWWGTNECAPVVRQGRYWYGEAQVNNRGQIGSRRRKSAEMSRNNWRPPKRTAQLAGVTNLGVLRGNPDRVQSEVRSDFVAQSPETLIYDGDGNLVRDGRWVYSWDAENRLVRVMSYGASDRAGWRQVDGPYDALGRRIRQTSYVLSNGVWVVTEDLKFVSDPVWFGRHIAELNATNHAVVRSYVWALNLSETLDGAGGAGGLLWVRVAGGPASETHFVTYDGNGNVWQLLSASTGTEAARYEYGPFGEPLRATGPAAPFNPFRFSTKRTDAATRLVLYEFRACSPSEGRWLNRDPAQEAGGCNLYGWVQNNTVGFYDLDGREIGGICPKCGQYKTGPWCANCAQSPRPPAFCVYWRGFGKLMFRIDGPWCVWTATLAVDVCGGKCPKTLSIERKIPLSPRWQLTVLLCLCPPGPEFTRCSGKAP